MSLPFFPTFSSPVNNGQNGYPMLYYAPYNPFEHPHVDPASLSFYTMPSVNPEHLPLYYTIGQHGSYVLLTPQASLQGDLTLSSQQADLSRGIAEPPQADVPTARSESVDSSQPSDPSPSFYDSRNHSNMLDTSVEVIGRKSRRSGRKFRNTSTYKTMSCNMFSTNGSCSYGAGCQYAHGQEDIRPAIPHPKYKTQLCNKFNSARGCQYGEKCHFRHPDDHEVQSRLSAGESSPQRATSNESSGN